MTSPYCCFLVVTPGQESLALSELKSKFLQKDYQAETLRGGVQLTTDNLALVYSLNHYLKIPTRILLRLSQFRSTDGVHFYKQVEGLPWSQILCGKSVRWRVTSRSSRLNNAKYLESKAQEALDAYVKKHPLKKGARSFDIQEIFIRVFRDEVEISLDTTGDPLYRRGLKKLSVEAPMRESHAAACLTEMNFFESGAQLLDPFCGSGTVLFEAATFFQKIKSRAFTYQGFRKNFAVTAAYKVELKQPDLRLIGSDVSPKAIQAATGNAESAKVEVDFKVKSAEDYTSGDIGEPLMVLSNPPYGDRVGLESDGATMHEVIEKLLLTLQPMKAGFLLPTKFQPKSLQGYKVKRPLSFKNGRIDVNLFVYTRGGR